MSTIVERNGRLVAQKSLYVLHHTDRFASEGAAICRALFPDNLRVFGRVISMYAASRARQNGGAVAALGSYFLASKLGGGTREAADKVIVWLEGVRDWLWAEMGVLPSDEEIRAASVREQEAENAENLAQLALAGGINRENLERALEATEAEISRSRALALLLRRRLAVEK